MCNYREGVCLLIETNHIDLPLHKIIVNECRGVHVIAFLVLF